MVNKYHAKKTACRQGHTHDSAREAGRCNELTMLERVGEIRNLEQHPVFRFIINGRAVKMRNGQEAKYTGDFSYFQGNEQVVEDVKSPATITEAYRLRRALVEAIYGVRVREV